FYLRANTTTQIDAAVLLANDRDPDVNDPLTVTAVSAVSLDRGAAVSLVNGRVVYDPRGVAGLQNLPAGPRGTDRFGYTVPDGWGQTATAIVQVVVQSPGNVAPTVTPAALTITQNGAYDGSSLLRNGSDSDALPGDAALQAVAGQVTSNRGAKVTVNADGTFTYDASTAPAVLALGDGQILQDSFTYQVRDSQGGTATGTLTLTVTGLNDAPRALDDHYTVGEHGLLAIPVATGLLANDADPDAGDQIVLDPTASDLTSAGGAKLLLRPDGSCNYDRDAALARLQEREAFEDTFTYTILDLHGGTTHATVHVVITGANDAPHAPDHDVTSGLWTIPGQKLVVSADQGLLAGVTDP